MRRHDDPPPSYYEPPEPKPPRCPVCMQECSHVYKSYWGDIVGCDECLEELDEWEEDE